MAVAKDSSRSVVPKKWINNYKQTDADVGCHGSITRTPNNATSKCVNRKWFQYLFPFSWATKHAGYIKRKSRCSRSMWMNRARIRRTVSDCQGKRIKQTNKQLIHLSWASMSFFHVGLTSKKVSVKISSTLQLHGFRSYFINITWRLFSCKNEHMSGGGEENETL